VNLAHIDIGLCVPVLNECRVIGSFLDNITACLTGGSYTICIIDDGSIDGTVELIEDRARSDHRIVLLKRRKDGPGCRRGGASRAGLQWLLANTPHSFFSDVDVDGANDPQELLRAPAIAAEAEADIIIASKYVRGSVVTGRPFVRRVGSRFYSLMLRVLMDWRIHDYSNSFRIYRRDAALLLQRYEPIYDTPVYLLEMLAIWLAHGLCIVEMPTIYRERQSGASKVMPSDFLRGAAGAVRVATAFRAGKFS
jgi:dolichol-phosphate mannosyltransferase